MDMLQQISAVGFVFLLLGGVVWALRKNRSSQTMRLPWLSRSAPKPGRQMELLDRLPLTPQHSLHVVRVLEATYLVATHTGGTTMVPVAAPANFQDMFAKAIGKQEGSDPCAF